MDFKDLDGPSKAPAAKAPRFAPKSSKFQPVAKPKREPEPPAPSSESVPAVVPKVELDDLKPPLVATVHSKTEIKQPSHTDPIGNVKFDTGASEMEVDNGNVKLDSDATEMEVNNDQQEDEKDQVVREIDVFFNSSSDPNSKLYVLQYPLRQRWRPYELEDRCEKVRLKPKTAEVEVELSVQVDSENFDRDVGDEKAMKKQVLSTSWKPSKANGYAVGILVGNELHLNPVNAVVQLRPSMQHINPQKNMNATHADVDMTDSEDIKDLKTIKQPKKQVKVPNEQTENTKEEEWISLKYHGEMSKLSHKCMDNLVQRQDSEIQFPMSPSDYIDSLCPATGVKSKRPSVTALLQLPLEERFKSVLLEGPPVRFNLLKHIAPDSTILEIFQVLQTQAHLIQGLWVANSTLKYNQNVGKENLLRDYIMLQFTKKTIFPESDLPKQTSLSETMKILLDEFSARRSSCRDWKFRELPDKLFVKEYPNIVEEQKCFWDSKEPQINNVLFPPNQKRGIRDMTHSIKNKNNVETKTVNVQASKGVVVPDEAREALPKALQKLLYS